MYVQSREDNIDYHSKPFSLPFRGRNFFGIDCQVFLPIMTAFFASAEVTTDVRVLKNAISSASFHGKSPPFPIPRDELAAATTMEKCRMISREL